MLLILRACASDWRLEWLYASDPSCLCVGLTPDRFSGLGRPPASPTAERTVPGLSPDRFSGSGRPPASPTAERTLPRIPHESRESARKWAQYLKCIGEIQEFA